MVVFWFVARSSVIEVTDVSGVLNRPDNGCSKQLIRIYTLPNNLPQEMDDYKPAFIFKEMSKPFILSVQETSFVNFPLRLLFILL